MSPNPRGCVARPARGWLRLHVSQTSLLSSTFSLRRFRLLHHPTRTMCHVAGLPRRHHQEISAAGCDYICVDLWDVYACSHVSKRERRTRRSAKGERGETVGHAAPRLHLTGPQVITTCVHCSSSTGTTWKNAINTLSLSLTGASKHTHPKHHYNIVIQSSRASALFFCPHESLSPFAEQTTRTPNHF